MRAEYGVMVSRPKLAIDFEYVEPHQRDIDGDLRNWALDQRNGIRQNVAAGFSQYQSPPGVRRERGSPISVDHGAAVMLNKEIIKLPERNRLALHWCYVKKSSPKTGCKTCGTTAQGLYQLIRDARQMLINRCV